jgi:hypothetical protein
VAARRFPGFEHAEHEALRWIGFYNRERLHEELGDVPPVEYEGNFHRARQADALSGDLRSSEPAGNGSARPIPGPSDPPRPAGLGVKKHAT